ncbi:MAG: hypothetical protein H6R21_2568, partial [Proteobacteria bacterium]|nr:hypothetical protein [Pseudomonadota bacterium]
MYLELDRQLDLPAVTGVEAGGLDVGLELAQDGRVRVGVEARCLEIGGQPHLQHIVLFLG